MVSNVKDKDLQDLAYSQVLGPTHLLLFIPRTIAKNQTTEEVQGRRSKLPYFLHSGNQ